MNLPPDVGIAVDYDRRWVEVRRDVDLDIWPRETAEAIWSRIGERPTRENREALEAKLRGGAGVILGQQGFLGFLLLPTPVIGLRAAAVFSVATLPGIRDPAAARDMAARALIPADDRLAEPAERIELETSAGTALRVRLRIVDPVEVSDVRETLAYIWSLPDLGAVMMLHTSFVDLVEAGRWRTAVDALAAKVRRLGGATS